MADEPNSESTPFALRGLNNVFSQRQANIFGNLKVLEDAHEIIHNETRSERKMIEKMTWREPEPVVESLEEQKQLKNRKTFVQGLSLPLTNDAPAFKVPSGSPRDRGSGGRRGRGRHGFDPSKYTHYSLADVDEDAGAERSIANDLMNRLRQRRLEAEENQGDQDITDDCAGDRQPARILFRSTRGKKMRRMDEASNSPSVVPISDLIVHDDNYEIDETNSKGEDTTSSTFRSRRSRQAAKRTFLPLDDDDEEEAEEAGGEKSSHPEPSPPFSDFTEPEDDDTLEDVPEGL